MKKNGTMRVAALLLALTLISSCFVGSTFAKYVTSTTVQDTARVAYWGFKATAELDLDLFDGEYDKDTADFIESTLTVVAENDDNVIAPGTSKEVKFSFAYTDNAAKDIQAPEVAYNFTVNATVGGIATGYSALDANKNFYWTLDGVKCDANGDGNSTVEELIAAIKALSGHESGSQDYAAGDLPAAFATVNGNDAIEHTIGWEWIYHTDANADAYDTIMGNAENLDDLIITITITAEQID